MLRVVVPIILVVTSFGCTSLSPRKIWHRDKPVENQPQPSPVSQLGVALPAMKPGDERELNLIAASEMAKNGYWKEAVKLYKDAEVMAPKKPKLDAVLAPALAGAGEYQESLLRYRRMVEADPENAELTNNFAWTLMTSGDTISAETEFRRALVMDPKYEHAAVNLGLMLARQNRDDEAFAVLSESIGDIAAHHNLGVVAIDMGNEPLAKHHFALSTQSAQAPQASRDFLAALGGKRSTIR
jgi:Flp pilus assembly protein TadD